MQIKTRYKHSLFTKNENYSYNKPISSLCRYLTEIKNEKANYLKISCYVNNLNDKKV